MKCITVIGWAKVDNITLFYNFYSVFLREKDPPENVCALSIQVPNTPYSRINHQLSIIMHAVLQGIQAYLTLTSP